VAENTEPPHATRCSLGYTFSSFFGSPLAGVAAAALVWQSVFWVAGGALVGMAAVCLTLFLMMERRGIVKYGQYKPQKQGRAGAVGVLIRHRIVKFSLISILTGVVRATVVFWLPTYINEYLGFDPGTSAALFTATRRTLLLRALIGLLHGKAHLSVLADTDDLHLYGLALRDEIADLLNENRRHFGDMYHTGFALTKINERTKIGDTCDFAFNNCSNLKLHKYRLPPITFLNFYSPAMLMNTRSPGIA
jgi:hypothetical protein